MYIFTLQGAIILLSNPCSHPLMKKLLPAVGVCLHDTSEKVRIAFADVLLAVKQTNSIFVSFCLYLRVDSLGSIWRSDFRSLSKMHLMLTFNARVANTFFHILQTDDPMAHHLPGAIVRNVACSCTNILKHSNIRYAASATHLGRWMWATHLGRWTEAAQSVSTWLTDKEDELVEETKRHLLVQRCTTFSL